MLGDIASAGLTIYRICCRCRRLHIVILIVVVVAVQLCSLAAQQHLEQMENIQARKE